MFVDASALVAILLGEAGAEQLSARIEASDRPMTSAIALYETVLAISRVHARGLTDAESKVRAFVHLARVTVEPIGEQASSLAIAAYAAYGKGRGHPARLNLGDCFAYAMAKQHGVPLLYKGDDFSRTDLA
jgi:ribonuclease VapC